MTLLSVEGLCIGTGPASRWSGTSRWRWCPGRSSGIVGESGSGKTMTALSLLGLLPDGVQVSSGRRR